MSVSDSASASTSVSASVSVSTSMSESLNTSLSASMSTSASSSEVQDPKIKRGSQALPKTGEEDSLAALALGALATATGLAFLVKRKKDDEESEDY